MKRNTPSDRLSRDVMAAQAMGVSYGRYKALYPSQGSEESEPLTVDPDKREIKCKFCGKTFIAASGHTNRRYCDDECKQAAWTARYQAQNSENHTGYFCGVCGIPIALDHGRKYCSRSCQNHANREKAKLRQRKIRTEAKEKI